MLPEPLSELPGAVLRPMIDADLDGGLRLSTLAGWNQRLDDWWFFFHCNPTGRFTVEYESQVVGTVTTIDYAHKSSWVGMVLVDPQVRGRGLGTRLLLEALRALDACSVIKLDATPMGEPVYRKLGFLGEYRLSRMTVPLGTVLSRMSPAAHMSGCVRPMTPADLAEVVQLDAYAFGVERRNVIEEWFRRAPGYAFVAQDADSVLCGFSLGRPGRNFEHIGPLVAHDLDTAKALAAKAFANVTGEAVLIDATQHNPEWLDWLAGLGFTEQRPFLRMYRGPHPNSGDTALMYAISGPELG